MPARALVSTPVDFFHEILYDLTNLYECFQPFMHNPLYRDRFLPVKTADDVQHIAVQTFLWWVVRLLLQTLLVL